MSKNPPPDLPALPDAQNLILRIHRDLIDSYDEELEMEVEDRDVDPDGTRESPSVDAAERNWRRNYFQELFRLPVIDGRHVQVCTFSAGGVYAGSCVRLESNLIVNEASNLIALRVVDDEESHRNR